MNKQEEIFVEFVEAWRDEDWDKVASLAQPFWRDGLRQSALNQEKLYKDWMRQHGLKPIPVSGLDPRVALRRHRKLVKEGGYEPVNRIRGMLTGGAVVAIGGSLLRVEPTKMIRLVSRPTTKRFTVSMSDRKKLAKVGLSPNVCDVQAKALVNRNGALMEVNLNVRMVKEEGRWWFNPNSALRMTPA